MSLVVYLSSALTGIDEGDKYGGSVTYADVAWKHPGSTRSHPDLHIALRKAKDYVLNPSYSPFTLGDHVRFRHYRCPIYVNCASSRTGCGRATMMRNSKLGNDATKS